MLTNFRDDEHVPKKSPAPKRNEPDDARAKARRALETAHKREAILLAAARAFAQGGYRATTMHDIAREAGYTAPSLYAYFTGKEQIFVELAKLLSREFSAVFAEPVALTSPFPERLEQLLLRLFELADRHRDAVRVFMAARLSGEVLISQELAAGGNRAAEFSSVQLLTDWLRANAKDGELGERPLAECGLALAGLAHAFCLEWLAADGPESVAAQTSRVASLFLYGATGSERRSKSSRAR